ncbi:MAG: lactate utilization protein [Candidatus Levybacteria bacterium]|nr:lactate utilization protein [Candidatus Levybacteria bacterium]
MYTTLATSQAIDKTIGTLKENHFIPIHVSSRKDALEKIKELIPEGVSVMNGSSETLREIGYLDILKSREHKWNNLHDVVLAESDPKKQAELREQSVLSDFYVGSAHALSETGEIVIASNTGSQLPHLVFTSPNIILVVGSQKIVPTLSEAFKRLEEHVIPLENERMKGVYGVGTTHAKTLILHKENPMLGRKIYVVIVDEKLGF